MRPDSVVQVSERRLLDEADDVGDLEPVKMLVLEAPAEPLHDAVGLGGTVAGPDVGGAWAGSR